LAGAIELTERDLTLFHVLAQNRCAWADDLFFILRKKEPRYQKDGTSSTPYKKFSERNRKLFDHLYLDRLDVPGSWLPKGGRKPIVYALGDAGARHLAEKTGYPVTVSKGRREYWAKLNREIGPTRILHELRATGILATLNRALPDGSFTWFGDYEWKAHAKKPTVEITWNRQTARQGIYPDRGFFVTVRDGDHEQTRYFMIEVDNATEPGVRGTLRGGTSLLRKYLGYHTWWRSGLHKKPPASLDGGFVVLTITTSQERALNLREIARSVDNRGGSHLFWSTSFDQFEEEPARIFDPIFWSAGDPRESKRRHSLFEPSSATRDSSRSRLVVVE